MILTVRISDHKVTNNSSATIITHSLGSCLGVTLYNPVQGIGGMLHALLPQAKMNPERAKANPFMFVDSGFEELLNHVIEDPAEKRKLVCKVAGCGVFLDKQGAFKIGERNYTTLRKVLWKHQILIAGERVGGSEPQTLVLQMATGETFVRIRGKELAL